MQSNHQSMTLLDVSDDWESSPRVPIMSVEQLRDELIIYSKKRPGFLNLEFPSGNLLQLGLGGEFACAQFTRHDNMPPYLCAKAKSVRTTQDVEFLLGLTPTPVEPEKCLSFGEALKIAEYFFETGERDPTVEWVEV